MISVYKLKHKYIFEGLLNYSLVDILKALKLLNGIKRALIDQ